MPEIPAAYPAVASRADWLAARKKLLAREREVTHLRDAVNAERKRLPMVKVEKDYRFEGPDGELRLIDMFEGRTSSTSTTSCGSTTSTRAVPSCTVAGDLQFNEQSLALLHGRDLTLACVSRAPYASIARYRDSHGWTFPWYSSQRQRLHLRLPRHAEPGPDADRVQLQDPRRAARRRLHRRRTARRPTWRQHLPAPRRRGVPHLLRLRARAWTTRRSAIRSST